MADLTSEASSDDISLPPGIFPLEELNFWTWRGIKSALWWWMWCWYGWPFHERSRESIANFGLLRGEFLSTVTIILSSAPFILIIAIVFIIYAYDIGGDKYIFLNSLFYSVEFININIDIIVGIALLAVFILFFEMSIEGIGGVFGFIIAISVPFIVIYIIASTGSFVPYQIILKILLFSFVFFMVMRFTVICYVIVVAYYAAFCAIELFKFNIEFYVLTGLSVAFISRFNAYLFFLASIIYVYACFFTIAGFIYGMGADVMPNSLYFIIGGAFVYASPLSYIVHVLFLFRLIDLRFLRFHPSFCCSGGSFQYFRLSNLLLRYAQLDRQLGERALDRLIDLGPQRWEALRARAILLIRDAHDLFLGNLAESLEKLPEGDEGWLTRTAEVKRLVKAIAQAAASVDQLSGPGLKARAVDDLITRIMAFQGTISGYPKPLEPELRAASAKWLEKAQALRGWVRADDETTIPQVFSVRDAISRDQDAFVPRLAVVDDLTEQALLANGCPGILLYGRRRTGKSTILKSFVGLLPASLIARSISLQGGEISANYGAFLRAVAAMVVEGVGLEVRIPGELDLPGLTRILARADGVMAERNQRLILGIDEYELLDIWVGEGRVPMDFLHALRDSIQTHRHLVWLLSGSHHYDNLPNVPWTSFLISTRQADVPMFTPDETRALLTDPLAHSRYYQKGEERPRLGEEFWGADGIDWVYAESGGWPVLVQALAALAVTAANRRESRVFPLDAREQVIASVLRESRPVLSELLLGKQENRFDGEREYVAAFAHTDAQPPPDDPDVRRHLLRREIIARGEDEQWRLRVPLMRRWLESERDYL